MPNEYEVFWVTAKRNGVCIECEEPILEGDRMVWNPSENKAYCQSCGQDVIGMEF